MAQPIAQLMAFSRTASAYLIGAAVLLGLAALASPAWAKDSLGVFSDWGAFRDPNIPRCYAIAIAEPDDSADEYQPFASIGTWPRRQLRGQLHLRLSRKISPAAEIRLVVGNKRFLLSGGGGDAWAEDKRMDAAIIAAMRSASRMTVSARDAGGKLFTDRYQLAGAATAMDAATVGCARLK